MKHILNNLTESEKNSIRKQHLGGMSVETKRFHKLLTEKLGNVKPLIEQNTDGTYKSNVDRYIENGYQKVTKVSLPDGTYIYEGAADMCEILDIDGKTQTGYSVEMPYSIRGMWRPTKVQVKDGQFVNSEFKTILFKNLGYTPKQQPQGESQGESQAVRNKVATEGLKNVTPQMVSAPPFKGTYSGYEIYGNFNGVEYSWDLNGVEGMIGVRGAQEGVIPTENNSYLQNYGITDANPQGVWIGFADDSSNKPNFVCYYNKNNKYVVKRL